MKMMRWKAYFGVLLAIVSAMIYAVCISRNVDMGFWYGVVAIVFAGSMILFDQGLKDIETMRHDNAIMAQYIREIFLRGQQRPPKL